MTIADPVFVFKVPSYQLFNWHHPKHHLIVNVVLLTKTEMHMVSTREGSQIFFFSSSKPNNL